MSDPKARAIHFGAGNIGRGFIAPLLTDSGYHVTFTDVDKQLIEAINHTGAYNVHILNSTADPSSSEDGKSQVQKISRRPHSRRPDHHFCSDRRNRTPTNQTHHHRSWPLCSRQNRPSTRRGHPSALRSRRWTHQRHRVRERYRGDGQVR
ncbi:hypothetical protein R3P38DRAFT_3539033 [Favolaschia claudopus]|uniref:Mannitol dehydrogenase N-terminal domain-containing protein n=1 Tax=Favolaschia claudopus TaxID=2862362 RepID=A0AAW0B9N4_9AGAR